MSLNADYSVNSYAGIINKEDFYKPKGELEKKLKDRKLDIESKIENINSRMKSNENVTFVEKRQMLGLKKTVIMLDSQIKELPENHDSLCITNLQKVIELFENRINTIEEKSQTEGLFSEESEELSARREQVKKLHEILNRFEMNAS